MVWLIAHLPPFNQLSSQRVASHRIVTHVPGVNYADENCYYCEYEHNNDVKWCKEMLDKIGNGTIPTKRELETANTLWRQYK